MAKGVWRIILTGTLGFVIFLILLALANYLTGFIHVSVYLAVVHFLIENIYLSFLIFLFTMAAEILWDFEFPLNAAAPIVSAVSAFVILEYFYRVWLLIGDLTGVVMSIPKGIISLVVFWAVILFGYIAIFVRIPKTKEKAEEGKNGRRTVSWEDIGREFKLAFFSLAEALNRVFGSDSQKNKRRKNKRKSS